MLACLEGCITERRIAPAAPPTFSTYKKKCGRFQKTEVKIVRNDDILYDVTACWNIIQKENNYTLHAV